MRTTFAPGASGDPRSRQWHQVVIVGEAAVSEMQHVATADAAFVELSCVLIEVIRPGCPRQPAVAAGGHPAVLLEPAVAEHFEVLQPPHVRRVRISYAAALNVMVSTALIAAQAVSVVWFVFIGSSPFID